METASDVCVTQGKYFYHRIFFNEIVSLFYKESSDACKYFEKNVITSCSTEMYEMYQIMILQLYD